MRRLAFVNLVFGFGPRCSGVMLTACLAVALAAGPVDVIAVPGDSGEVKKSLTKALAGTTLVDESAAWSYLHSKNMLGMQDFKEFTAEPIAGWPAELSETWRSGVASCREVAGPPPWKAQTVGSASACANRLSAFLWTKLLQHRAARAVYVVRTDQKGKNELTLSGEVYGPLDATAVSVTEETNSAGLAKAATKVVAALVAKKGSSSKRDVVTELSSTPAPGVDLLATEAVVTDAVANVKTCAASPAALEVTPSSVLATSLAGRWAASVKGAAPKASCTLALSQYDEDSLAGPVTVLRAAAKCGSVSAVAEGATMARGKLASRLSEKLVRDLAARFCP